MPDESEPHRRTFLCFPTRKSIWGRYLPHVQEDVAAVARAIAEFEPVVLCAAARHVERARRVCGGAAEVRPIPADDLWARDTAPTFVLGPAGLAGVDLNFNAWGNKPQSHDEDAVLARRLLAHYGIERIQAPIVGEGGSLETDGRGTFMATESSLVDGNRNPGRSREDIESALATLFGARKVIWFPGVRGQDITDAHVDALARFAGPGVVLLNRPAPGSPPDAFSRSSDEAKAILERATDADGRALEIVELPEADAHLIAPGVEDFLASYVNHYVCNGAVILPRFGDRTADDRAAAILRDLYSGREIVQVAIDYLAAGGGGIHCATQQQPAG